MSPTGTSSWVCVYPGVTDTSGQGTSSSKSSCGRGRSSCKVYTVLLSVFCPKARRLPCVRAVTSPTPRSQPTVTTERRPRRSHPPLCPQFTRLTRGKQGGIWERRGERYPALHTSPGTCRPTRSAVSTPWKALWVYMGGGWRCSRVSLDVYSVCVDGLCV